MGHGVVHGGEDVKFCAGEMTYDGSFFLQYAIIMPLAAVRVFAAASATYQTRDTPIMRSFMKMSVFSLVVTHTRILPINSRPRCISLSTPTGRMLPSRDGPVRL